MKVSRALGVAGILGVTASGVVVLRRERTRRSLSPDQVCEVLLARHARAVRDETSAAAEEVATTATTVADTPALHDVYVGRHRAP